MANGACQNEEVEHGVHIATLVQAIEDCSSDIAYTLGNNPNDGGSRDAVDKRLESDEH